MSRKTDRGANGGGRRLAGVAFAAIVMASALAVAPVPTAAQSNATSTQPNTTSAQSNTTSAQPNATAARSNATFVVEQGSQCTEVTPLGNGTKTVEDYYDYEVLNDTANYSSLGTVDIQEDNTSQVFVYRGSDGLSLVFLHGKIHTGSGFVATADLSGLPSDGEWAVEDDNYTDRDDSFNYTDTGAHIAWNGNGKRTDGAAFRGLGSSNYSTIDVDVKFNERAEQYPFEEWTGSPEDNRIERWIVRSGTGETTELDMNESIAIRPGTCDGGAPANGSNASATSGPSASTSSNVTTGMTARNATTDNTAGTANGSTMDGATTQANAADETDGSATDESATGGNATAAGGDDNGNESGGGDGESGAFGPGFGVGVGLVAVLLAVGALARRKR